MIRNSPAAAIGAALLLSGCVPQTTAEPPRTRAPAPAPAAPAMPAPARPSYSLAGLEGVMGRTARALESTFGRPELDVREGSARKLQFASTACVLDAYLYPPQRGGEPVVTHIDARLPDGRDADRASCVEALRRQ
jgi:hypothetical protein